MKKIIKSILSWLLNNLVSILLILLISINAFLLLAIIFHWQKDFQDYFFQDIIINLSKIYHKNELSFIHLSTSFAGLLGLFILHLRNMEMKAQTKVQYETFNGNSQFQNFLEATKMLTDKDATNEAKISALYLLYDVAKSHPENLDRIIQVINKQLVLLMKCINNSNCSQQKYMRVLDNEAITLYPIVKSRKFKYIENAIIKIENLEDENYMRKTITQWQYNGNDTEKVIATALYLLKQIVVDIVQKQDEHIELSNTIIFDLDTDFTDKLKFQSIKRPTSNLIFLNCKLEKINFKKTKFVNCQFIHCKLTKSDFTNANLWGSSFINCDLEDVKFNQTECEGIEFKKCNNLVIKQIDKMQFSSVKEPYKGKVQLFILNKKDALKLSLNCFYSTISYNKWKERINAKN